MIEAPNYKKLHPKNFSFETSETKQNTSGIRFPSVPLSNSTSLNSFLDGHQLVKKLIDKNSSQAINISDEGVVKKQSNTINRIKLIQDMQDNRSLTNDNEISTVRLTQ